MKNILALGAVGLALCGCASLSQSPTVFTATQAFVAAESTFDGAVNLADAAVNSGGLSKSTDLEIGTLAAQGYAASKFGRAAVIAADATTIKAETSALITLASQLAAKH